MIDGIYIFGLILVSIIPTVICCVQHINEIEENKQESKYLRI